VAFDFLLVFYSNHSHKMHHFKVGGMGQTDRRTDGRIAALLNAPPGPTVRREYENTVDENRV